ncbi:glycosyltransferase [bacterium]|nr:glycosyltransferase [bacterium]
MGSNPIGHSFKRDYGIEILPKISIIIAAYNVEKYLPKCLDSVCLQTLKDIEIICINDGSKDKSLDILNEYAQKDSRIKVINQNNSGVATARNVGLANATGEYVQFIDGDDWVNLNLCEKVYNIAENNNSDIVMFNVAFYDNKKQQVTKGRFFTTTVWNNHVDENTAHTYKDCKTIFYGNLSAANKLYRKSFLDALEVKFPENVRFEDHLFHLETIFSAEKVNILDEQLYYYRQNRKNSMMTTLKTTKVVMDIFPIVDLVEEMLKRINKYERNKYLFFQFKYEALAHYFMSINFFSKPYYFAKMKTEFEKLLVGDFDFGICKTMSNYYNFTDVLNYNWFSCYVLKKVLDKPNKEYRKKFEPFKKAIESGFSKVEL